jgi:hypothetical protein
LALGKAKLVRQKDAQEVRIRDRPRVGGLNRLGHLLIVSESAAEVNANGVTGIIAALISRWTSTAVLSKSRSEH